MQLSFFPPVLYAYKKIIHNKILTYKMNLMSYHLVDTSITVTLILYLILWIYGSVKILNKNGHHSWNFSSLKIENWGRRGWGICSSIFFKSKIIYTYTQKYTIFQQPKIFFPLIFDHEKYWKYIGKLYLIIGVFQFFFSNKFPLKNLVAAVT